MARLNRRDALAAAEFVRCGQDTASDSIDGFHRENNNESVTRPSSVGSTDNGPRDLVRPFAAQEDLYARVLYAPVGTEKVRVFAKALHLGDANTGDVELPQAFFHLLKNHRAHDRRNLSQRSVRELASCGPPRISRAGLRSPQARGSFL